MKSIYNIKIVMKLESRIIMTLYQILEFFFVNILKVLDFNLTPKSMISRMISGIFL